MTENMEKRNRNSREFYLLFSPLDGSSHTRKIDLKKIGLMPHPMTQSSFVPMHESVVALHVVSTRVWKIGRALETELDQFCRFYWKSTKPVKTDTKFKSTKILSWIDKSNKNLINRHVLSVYQTGFEQTRFCWFCYLPGSKKSGKINKNHRYYYQLFVHIIHNFDM
jgi:hypothetical protein